MAIITQTILSTDEYLEVYPQDTNVDTDIIAGSINDATITLDAICGGMIAKVWPVIDPTDPNYRTDEEKNYIKQAHAIQAHEGVCRSVDFTGGSESYTSGSNNFNQSRTTPGIVADEIIYQLLAKARVYNPNITTDTTIAGAERDLWDPTYDPAQEYITLELADNRYIHKHAEQTGMANKFLRYDANGNITYVDITDISGGYEPDFETIGLTSNNTLGVLDYISATQVESIRQVLVDAVNNKANQSDLTAETTARENADTALGVRIDAVVPVITEITAHQTINTYEVPTLTVSQVQNLYNSVVAGRTTIIHFDPSDLGIDTDYVITQASNVSGVAIRFIYNDTMILTYTIENDSVVISYKDIGGSGEQPHLYLHSTLLIWENTSGDYYRFWFSFFSPYSEKCTDINNLLSNILQNPVLNERYVLPYNCTVWKGQPAPEHYQTYEIGYNLYEDYSTLRLEWLEGTNQKNLSIQSNSTSVSLYQDNITQIF